MKLNALHDDDDEDVAGFLNNLKIVRAAIREKHPESDKFVKDNIPCPVCKAGTVCYVISDHFNGHIQAGCSTENCIRWAE